MCEPRAGAPGAAAGTFGETQAHPLKTHKARPLLHRGVAHGSRGSTSPALMRANTHACVHGAGVGG